MKLFIKVILIFFIFNQAVFAEWKTTGWKVGDKFWWSVIISKKDCQKKVFAWEIKGIKDGVAKLLDKENDKIKYKELKDVWGFSSLESVEKYIKDSVKKCELKERYEKN